MRVKESNGSHTIYTKAQVDAIIQACEIVNITPNATLASIYAAYASKLGIPIEILKSVVRPICHVCGQDLRQGKCDGGAICRVKGNA
jgi:hypothetical protein